MYAEPLIRLLLAPGLASYTRTWNFTIIKNSKQNHT